MKLLFAIRDDDTSFFTNAMELEDAYGNLWDKIPISLGVIPCDVKTYNRGNQLKFFQESEPIPITENFSLIKFLGESIEKGRLEIMLHGYDHQYKINPDLTRIPEFIWRSDLESRVRKGQTILKDALGVNVTSFVPPSNAIGQRGLKAITKARLNLLGVTGTRSLMRVNPVNLGYALTSRLNKSYPYNVREFVGHKQLMCRSLAPRSNWLRLLSDFEECRKKEGVFIVATHYWESKSKHDTEKRTITDLLLNLIEKANDSGAKFVGVEEAFAKEKS